MKKKLLILSIIVFGLISVSACVFAISCNNNYDSYSMTYQSGINGNAQTEDYIKNYKCDLRTLPQLTIYYNSLHQFGNTLKIYTTCIKEYPKDETLYNNRGNVYKMLKKYDEALADYEKAISLKPEYLSAYNGKMSLFLIKGNYDEALAISDEIIKINPKSDDTYYQRGIIYFAKRNDEEALNNFNLSIKYNSKSNPGVYFYKGNIYSLKEDWESAIKNYRKSIEYYLNNKNNVVSIDDSVADAYYNLGIAYIRIGKFEKALDSLVSATRYYKAYGNEEKLRVTEELVNTLLSNKKNHK